MDRIPRRDVADTAEPRLLHQKVNLWGPIRPIRGGRFGLPLWKAALVELQKWLVKGRYEVDRMESMECIVDGRSPGATRPTRPAIGAPGNGASRVRARWALGLGHWPRVPRGPYTHAHTHTHTHTHTHSHTHTHTRTNRDGFNRAALPHDLHIHSNHHNHLHHNKK